MRTATLRRTTKETSVEITVGVDGTGRGSIDTPIGFLSHMLDAVARHAQLDLEVSAAGDTFIDYHHTVEDVGLVFGEVFAAALGDKRGIRRFGHAYVPLDREMLLIHKDFPFALVEEFFKSFANKCACNIHIDLIRGRNGHHAAEAIFKAFAIAVREAKQIVGTEVPSTKGVI